MAFVFGMCGSVSSGVNHVSHEKNQCTVKCSPLLTVFEVLSEIYVLFFTAVFCSGTSEASLVLTLSLLMKWVTTLDLAMTQVKLDNDKA